jgi:hypothetical protein
VGLEQGNKGVGEAADADDADLELFHKDSLLYV